MSGHSKWKTIQHKKGAADAKRSKIFAKYAKEIYVAAKSGDSNPDNNPSLRAAIDKARSQSMPKDNIERAIARAFGGKDNANYEEIIYEGYGPSGVAIMLYCLTDNRNRTASFVKSTFSKRGGNLGADGSVSYMFHRRGVIAIMKENIKIDLEEFELNILDLNIEDIQDEDDVIVLTCDPKEYQNIKSFIDENKYANEFITAEITMIPNMNVELEEASAMKVMQLVDALEDNDDIQDVFHNLK
ncbi:MAG: YebC/PmpR family DNA-binding transcriptional regulator [Mycoplasmatales bacterium]